MKLTTPHQRLVLITVLMLSCAGTALADTAALDALSSKDAAGGLRAALSKGVDVAVSQLGAPNGFLNDPKVAIPLPGGLETVSYTHLDVYKRQPLHAFHE